ncbi:hypothetical protein YC2023_047265 [Brassica napus]
MEEKRLEGKELKYQAGEKNVRHLKRQERVLIRQLKEPTRQKILLRGNEAKGTIFGALGNVTDAIRAN